jgi:ribosomal protein L37E
MMNAVKIMSHIADHTFSDDVAKFVACCALEEGVFCLPEPLDFAQDWAARPEYRCKECGRIDRDDENDECDHCGAPQSSLVRGYARDPRPAKARYEECIRKGDDRDELQETVVDVQVARLLVARDYMLQRERDLIKQAEAVRDGKKVPSQPSAV